MRMNNVNKRTSVGGRASPVQLVTVCLLAIVAVVAVVVECRSSPPAVNVNPSKNNDKIVHFAIKRVNFASDPQSEQLYRLTSSYNRLQSLSKAKEQQRRQQSAAPAAPPPSSNSPTDVPLGGSISLLPTGAYFVEVGVGTPAQTVLALLDSGSNDFLVTTVECDGCNKPSTTEYDFGASTTVSKLNCNTTAVSCPKCDNDLCNFFNEYITCAPNNPDQVCILEGPILNDVFSIPGSDLSVNVNFGAITFMNITFPGPISAIWGVAANHNYTAFGEIGPLEALAQSGQIKNMFSVCLLQENGTFSLGGIDESLYIGTIGFTPILSQAEFAVETLDILVNGESLGYPSSAYNIQNGSIIDTGTYSIVVPTNVYNSIAEAVSSECDTTDLVGVCNVPSGKSLFDGLCYDMTQSDISAFPPIEVAFNGVTVKIDGNNYLVSNITNPSCYTWGFQDGGDGSITIHGDVLMKGFYSVFDKTNMMIGFAPANQTACASRVY